MKKQEFINKIQKVADILGYTMTVPEDSYQNQAVLTHDNKTIYIRNGGYKNEGKIHVFSSYPRDCHGQSSSYGLKNVSINCSQNKTSEQIARDIQKRFLPDYMADLQIVIERNKVTQAQADARYNTLKTIASFLGIALKKDDHTKEATLPIWNVLPGLNKLEVSYDGSRVDLKLELTSAQAVQILTVLKGEHK